MAEKTKVLILGAGYAGLVAALELSGRPRFMRRADVTLVDRNDYHLLVTELHRVAACEIDPARVCIPVDDVLKDTCVEFARAEAVQVDPARRVVETRAGDMEYDYLLVATGSVNRFRDIPGVEKNTLPMRSLEQALDISKRFEALLRDSREKKAPPVAVIGAGPTGVELAAYMRGQAEKRGANVPVMLVEAEKRILPAGRYTRRIVRKTEKHLEKLGVELTTGSAVEKVTKNFITTEGEGKRRISMAVWTAGIGAADVSSALGPAGRDGRVQVRPDLSLEAFPEIFVAGDAALVKGGRNPLPCSAQYALQEAEVAADNIVRKARGRKTSRYVPEQRGEFISIGRGTAMGWMGLVEIWGYDAQFVKDSILYKYILRLGPPALSRYLGV